MGLKATVSKIAPQMQNLLYTQHHREAQRDLRQMTVGR